MTASTTDPAQDLDAVVRRGWQDHAGDAGGVLARLPAMVDLVRAPAHLPALAALIVHVAGEHLGRWEDGLALLDRLQALPLHDASAPEGKALARSKAILHLCRGDATEAGRWTALGLSGGALPEASDRARIQATAASALAGQRRIDDAIRAWTQALAHASYGPDRNDPAARALAVTGNNLAAELEERAGRTAAETELMLSAAAAARRFWAIAGGWRETERADHRLAMSHLAAGRAREALEHAQACRALVAQNGDEPLEVFFAHDALAKARHALGEDTRADRDAAASAMSAAAEGDREWLAGELAKLDARLAAP